MKKIRKVLAVAMMGIMTLSLISTCAFAQNSDSVLVTIGGKLYEGHISTDLTPYGDVAADPVPHCDNAIMPRSAVVTDSYVRRVQLGADKEYPYEYVADGYVTMMDGSSEAYHYSRAEMWWNGAVNTSSGNIWGYGKVNATSWPTPNKGTARIFYGID